jgi:hypothetical protein
MKVDNANEKSNAGIIEAASVVVGSLKIKTQHNTKRTRTDSRIVRGRKRST